MIHAGTVASSPAELDASIARTEDLRDKLTVGGYGSAFGADDLFPLYEAFVAKATTATPAHAPVRPTRLVWVVLVVAVVVAVIVALLFAS